LDFLLARVVLWLVVAGIHYNWFSFQSVLLTVIAPVIVWFNQQMFLKNRDKKKPDNYLSILSGNGWNQPSADSLSRLTIT